MKVKLLRDARILHQAGDVVDVPPSVCDFLVSVGSAEVLAEKAIKPEIEVAEKAVIAPKAPTKAVKKPATKTRAKK